MRHIEVTTHVIQRFGIQRTHVDRMANGAGRQEINEQANSLDRHLRLRFFGAGAQGGGAKHTGQAKERTFGIWFCGEDINGHACDAARFERFDQRLFIIDAAAGAVDKSHSRF